MPGKPIFGDYDHPDQYEKLKVSYRFYIFDGNKAQLFTTERMDIKMTPTGFEYTFGFGNRFFGFDLNLLNSESCCIIIQDPQTYSNIHGSLYFHTANIMNTSNRVYATDPYKKEPVDESAHIDSYQNCYFAKVSEFVVTSEVNNSHVSFKIGSKIDLPSFYTNTSDQLTELRRLVKMQKYLELETSETPDNTTVE